MASLWPTLVDWLTFRPLRRRIWPVRGRPPIPTVPVETLLRQIESRLHDHAAMPGVKPPRAQVLLVTEDHVTWERLDRHRQRAEGNRQLAGAVPELLYLPRPARFLVRGLAKVAGMLARGITNRQTECNDALIVYTRGLAARLQACETQVLVLEEALRQMQARLPRTDNRDRQAA